VAFPLVGLASLVIGWPLARRRIPPNPWYGCWICPSSPRARGPTRL